MRLALLILGMPLVILVTGLLWFACLWSAHQEDHKQEHVQAAGEECRQ